MKPTYKHNAFIENTPEAREWLEGLGMVQDETLLGYEYPLIHTDICNNEIWGMEEWYLKEFKSIYSDFYNCRGNLPLFKAITAITDDTDKDQYFKILRYNECRGYIDTISICRSDIFSEANLTLFGVVESHKMIPEELIKYFKK